MKEFFAKLFARGEAHSDRRVSGLNEGGKKFLDQGQHEQARVYYKQALERVNAGQAVEDVERGQLWNNYGLSCRFTGNSGEAQTAYETALKIYRACEPPPVIEIVVTLSNLGRLALSNNENEAAWDYLTEELTLRKKQLASSPQELDVPATAWCLHNLAEVFCRRGKFDLAIQNLEQALGMRRKALGPEHDDVAENLKMLADVFFTVGDQRKAAQNYELALPMYRRMLGQGHILVSDIEKQLLKLTSYH
jgi:tetratricopeptide (TPR) repeat protein